MSIGHNRLTQMTIAIGSFVLAILAATPSVADGNPALKIRAVKVGGRLVAVSVANTSSRTQTGIVAAPAPLSNGSAVRTVVTVGAGETVNLGVVQPVPAPDCASPGVVVDDGVPF